MLENSQAHQAIVFAAIVLLANIPKAVLPEGPVHSVRRAKQSLLELQNMLLRVSIVLQGNILNGQEANKFVSIVPAVSHQMLVAASVTKSVLMVKATMVHQGAHSVQQANTLPLQRRVRYTKTVIYVPSTHIRNQWEITM